MHSKTAGQQAFPWGREELSFLAVLVNTLAGPGAMAHAMLSGLGKVGGGGGWNKDGCQLGLTEARLPEPPGLDR
jgi:hypothetical protein